MKASKLLEPELEVILDSNSAFRYLEYDAKSDHVRWHHHKEYEIHLTTYSKGTCFIGEHIGSFETWQLKLIGPHMPHNWVYDGDGAPDVQMNRQLNFDGDVLADVARLLPDLVKVQDLIDRAVTGIEFCDIDVDSYIQLFEEIKASNGAGRVAAVLNLLQSLLAEEDVQPFTASGVWTAKAPKKYQAVEEAIEFIQQNYMRKIQLEDVANHVGISSKRLSRYLLDNTGSNYIDFLTRLRISKACVALDMADDPITQICFKSGFNNVSNFNRHFLRIKGSTPQQYRQTCKLKRKTAFS